VVVVQAEEEEQEEREEEEEEEEVFEIISKPSSSLGFQSVQMVFECADGVL
jgi:hypothetical protein